MIDILKGIRHKLNGIIWTFISTGVILVLLGVLMVWTKFVVQLVMGLVTIVIAYVFIYAGLKFWHIKKEIDKL